MENKNRYNAKGHIIKTVWALVTVGIIISVAGCCKQIYMTNDHMLQSYTTTWLNTQQTACNMESIEDNEDKLHVAIENVQSNSRKKDADIVAVIEQEQSLLQYILLERNRQLSNSMMGIEQNQYIIAK